MDYDIKVTNFSQGAQGFGIIEGRIASGNDAGKSVQMLANADQISAIARHPSVTPALPQGLPVMHAALIGTNGSEVNLATLPKAPGQALPSGRLPAGYRGALKLSHLLPGEQTVAPVFVGPNGQPVTSGLMGGVAELPAGTSLEWAIVKNDAPKAPSLASAIADLPVLQVRNVRPYKPEFGAKPNEINLNARYADAAVTFKAPPERKPPKGFTP